MADEIDRQRITAEDIDTIRARMLANANIGVAPSSPAFLDAITGSLYGDLEGPAALELDEFYDFAEVVARATIPIDSYGDYLDDWAESVGLERRDRAAASGVLRFSGAPGTVVQGGAQFTTTAPADADPIAFRVAVGGQIAGSGLIDLEAVAVEEGSSGNVPATSVTIPAIEIDGLASVTNPAPMTGGADVEGDEQLRERVRLALAGGVGSGRVADYERWALSVPGVGFVTVRPIARGPGTVDVYITDTNNDPAPGALVATVQNLLDPVAGEGRGLAPIGHDVDVATPAGFAVTVEAIVAHDVGYSLDGTAGTRATRAAIESSIRAYIDSLPVGADVIRSKVIGAIVDVRGVANVDIEGAGALELNNATTGDVAVAANQVAFTSTISLT